MICLMWTFKTPTSAGFSYGGLNWFEGDTVCEVQGACSMTCDSVCAGFGLTCVENGGGAYTESPSCGSKNVCVAMHPGATCSPDGDGPKYKPSSNHCNSAGSMIHCGTYNNWNVGVKPICACA